MRLQSHTSSTSASRRVAWRQPWPIECGQIPQLFMMPRTAQPRPAFLHSTEPGLVVGKDVPCDLKSQSSVTFSVRVSRVQSWFNQPEGQCKTWCLKPCGFLTTSLFLGLEGAPPISAQTSMLPCCQHRHNCHCNAICLLICFLTPEAPRFGLQLCNCPTDRPNIPLF